CGTWVGAHISQCDPWNSAVQLPGSIGACAMNGASYMASTCRPFTLETSPAAYNATAFLVSAARSPSRIAVEVKSLCDPSSHVTFRTRLPSIAAQVLSPTTATALSPIFPTYVTPGTFLDSLSS